MTLAIAIMLSNYVHDLATGLLFGSVAAYLVARRVIRGTNEDEALQELGEALFKRFRPIVIGALAAVLLLGIPRMIFYYDYEWLPAAGRGQVAALIAKHVVLVSVTVVSLLAFFRKHPRTQETARNRGT